MDIIFYVNIKHPFYFPFFKHSSYSLTLVIINPYNLTQYIIGDSTSLFKNLFNFHQMLQILWEITFIT